MSSLEEPNCAHHAEKADDVGDDQRTDVCVPRLHDGWTANHDFPEGECPTSEEDNQKDEWDEFHLMSLLTFFAEKIWIKGLGQDQTPLTQLPCIFTFTVLPLA